MTVDLSNKCCPSQIDCGEPEGKHRLLFKDLTSSATSAGWLTSFSVPGRVGIKVSVTGKNSLLGRSCSKERLFARQSLDAPSLPPGHPQQFGPVKQAATPLWFFVPRL